MNKKLPSASKMYEALCDKNSSFEGIFIACVKTTGIFCRLTCRARKPKRENVEFVEDSREALRKGYRACKICLPVKPVQEAPEWIQRVLGSVEGSDEGLVGYAGGLERKQRLLELEGYL